MTLPAASRAMSTTDRCGGREKGTEKRPLLVQRRQRAVHPQPRAGLHGAAQGVLLAAPGAQRAIRDPDHGRSRVDHERPRRTGVVEQAAGLRHLDRVLAVAQPPRPEHEPAVTLRSRVPSPAGRRAPTVVDARSPSSPSMENASVDRPLSPTSRGPGSCRVEPAGSAAESERRHQTHTGSPTGDEEQRPASALVAHLARMAPLRPRCRRRA